VQNLQKLWAEKRLLILSSALSVLFLILLGQLFFLTKSTERTTRSQKISSASSRTVFNEATESAENRTLGAEEQASGGKSVVNNQTSKQTKKISFGVVPQDYNNSNEIFSLEASLGTKISTVSIYKPFGGSSKNLEVAALNYVKTHGSKLMITWEPWDLGATNTDYLAQINTGAQDTYIKSFAASIKQYGGPVVLRFAHEMNGDWYPWGDRATEFISAYRRVHDLFVSQSVGNVTWVWGINETYEPSTLSPFYPGNDVVDTIGISGFNFGTTQNFGGWKSFTTIFNPTYQFLVNNYNKPITVSEIASTEYGGDKAGWVTNMFTSELPSKFPKITEIVWFNLLKETDWRINSTPSSLQAFQNYFKQ